MDWAQIYRGNLDWIPARTIYLTRHGSHAYGTNTATSDLDLKGVAVPPREYFFGYAKRFEQAEGKKEPDLVIYDIRKFFNLATDCNPNIVEVLWTDASDHVVLTRIGALLLDARAKFLSRKAKHTFSGYAISQLKRIQTHHRWLLHPPKEPPTRAEYGLPERTVIPRDQLQAAESAIGKKLAAWDLDLEPLDPATRIALQARMAEILAEMKISAEESFRAAGRSLGYDDNFIELLDRERHYTARQREWEQFQNWKQTRNPQRAELEARFGYDTKHALHLVRLMRMCREILTTGRVNVRRADRDELLAIRSGAWSFDELIAWADAQERELEALVATSPLPHAPDRAELDALCVKLVETALADPEAFRSATA